MFGRLNSQVVRLEAKVPGTIMVISKSQYDTDKQNLEKKIKDVDKKIPNTSG